MKFKLEFSRVCFLLQNGNCLWGGESWSQAGRQQRSKLQGALPASCSTACSLPLGSGAAGVALYSGPKWGQDQTTVSRSTAKTSHAWHSLEVIFFNHSLKKKGVINYLIMPVFQRVHTMFYPPQEVRNSICFTCRLQQSPGKAPEVTRKNESSNGKTRTAWKGLLENLPSIANRFRINTIYLRSKSHSWTANFQLSTATIRSSSLLQKAWNLNPVKTKEFSCHLTSGMKTECTRHVRCRAERPQHPPRKNPELCRPP